MHLKTILSTIILFFCISIFAQEPELKKVEFPTGYESKIDVVYSKVNGWEGRLDAYYNPTSVKPTPVVLHIHGGGWNKGTKERNIS